MEIKKLTDKKQIHNIKTNKSAPILPLKPKNEVWKSY